MVGRVIWFTCEGENPADIENLGDMVYYPYQGIADYFYPYKNQRGYLSPVVFLHLKNPKSKSGRLNVPKAFYFKMPTNPGLFLFYFRSLHNEVTKIELQTPQKHNVLMCPVGNQAQGSREIHGSIYGGPLVTVSYTLTKFI